MFESVEAHLLSCVPLEELESEIFLGNWFKKEANKNSIPLIVFRDQENMEGKRCSLYRLDWLLEQRSERVVLFFPFFNSLFHFRWFVCILPIFGFPHSQEPFYDAYFAYERKEQAKKHSVWNTPSEWWLIKMCFLFAFNE